jgi:hypothetical protein
MDKSWTLKQNQLLNVLSICEIENYKKIKNNNNNNNGDNNNNFEFIK